MYSGFVLASVMICLVPGPSLLVVISNVAKRGLSQGFRAILGVIVADACLLAIVFSGVGALLQASPRWMEALQMAGALYLALIGGKILLTRGEGDLNSEKIGSMLSMPFFQAFGVTLMNPKILLFFTAFFPQFVESEESMASQLAILVPLFLAIVLLVFGMLAYLYSRVTLVAQDSGMNRLAEIVLGIALIVVALTQIVGAISA